MLTKWALVYKIKGETKEKKVLLPDTTEWIMPNKNAYYYGNKFGVKITYKVGSKKKEKIVSLSKGAEDILIKY